MNTWALFYTATFKSLSNRLKKKGGGEGEKTRREGDIEKEAGRRGGRKKETRGSDNEG